MNYDFTRRTILFSAFGIVLPGFTAFGVLSVMFVLTDLGVECPPQVYGLWTLAALCAVALPIGFHWHVRRLRPGQATRLGMQLAFFNLAEYASLQFALQPLFTDAHTFCFVSDGQNGIELVATGWLAIPILLGMSAWFTRAIRKNPPHKRSLKR